MRKNIPFLFIVLLLGALLTACASTARAQSATEAVSPESRTLSVNGSGGVSIVPDLAYISIGVHTEEENATEAVASNNSQTQKVMAALKGFGLSDKDIQTSNFSIYPRQDWGPNGERLGITYSVDNTVSVTVRDLDRVGEILDAVVQAGANRISGIRFDTSDRESAYQQALEVAMQNATARAEVLAEAAGVELGNVLQIETYIGGGGQAPVTRSFAMEAAADVPIATGEVELSVEVSVVFEIR